MSKTTIRTSTVIPVLLIPVVLLAALLRFFALTNRGFIYWDEGKFALEGVRMLSVLQAFPHFSAADVAGKSVGTAKPTHALGIALSYAVFGTHDYAPLLLSAIASVVAIGVLFLITRHLFGAGVGLIAAALLAVSGYDIIYARSALSESDANLFFLCGVLLWCRSRLGATSDVPVNWWRTIRPCVPAGLSLGLAFTTNYRLIVYVTVLVTIDLILAWKQRGWVHPLLSLPAWLVGLLVVPVLWQLIGVLAQAHGVILFRSEITHQPTSYFSEVLYQLHGGRQAALRFSPLPYLQWYAVRQGWLLTILLGAGLACAVIERTRRWIVPTVLIVVPFIIFMFAPFIVPRNLDPTLPFTALISAAGLVRLTALLRPQTLRRPLLVAVSVLLLLISSIGTWPLTEVRSGFAQAAAYVKRQHGEGALVVSEVMLFYLRDPGRGCDAPRVPISLTSLAAEDRKGYDYAVVDVYSWPLTGYLLRNAQRVAHYATISNTNLGEDLITSENGTPPLSPSQEYVDVYALDSLHLQKVPNRPLLQYCTQDWIA